MYKSTSTICDTSRKYEEFGGKVVRDVRKLRRDYLDSQREQQQELPIPASTSAAATTVTGTAGATTTAAKER